MPKCVLPMIAIRPGFRCRRQVSIQTISVVIPDDASPEQEMTLRHRAEDILQKAKAARNADDFGVLAEKNSDDNWRIMMGDHGLVEEDKMPPPVAQIAFRHETGRSQRSRSCRKFILHRASECK